MTAISLTDQIEAVRREIGFRKYVYPRRVAAGRMKQVDAVAVLGQSCGAPVFSLSLQQPITDRIDAVVRFSAEVGYWRPLALIAPRLQCSRRIAQLIRKGFFGEVIVEDSHVESYIAVVSDMTRMCAGNTQHNGQHKMGTTQHKLGG